MQGMMTVGGNGMPPSVPGNMTQQARVQSMCDSLAAGITMTFCADGFTILQAIVQMMQGLSVERVEMTPYGKTVPQEPGVRYIIASGQQECMQCEAIVAGAHFLGQSFDGICEFLGHGNMAVNSKMCHAQVCSTHAKSCRFVLLCCTLLVEPFNLLCKCHGDRPMFYKAVLNL